MDKLFKEVVIRIGLDTEREKRLEAASSVPFSGKDIEVIDIFSEEIDKIMDLGIILEALRAAGYSAELGE